MSSFKEFFYLTEKQAAPSAGKGVRFTNTGLRIGQGADFPHLGYGYQAIQGPQSMTQFVKDFEPGGLEHEKTEVGILKKAGQTFQAIWSFFASGDPDEEREARELFGKYVRIEGTVGNGGWIRNLLQSDGDGNGLMHRGIAKGFQMSGPEVEYLKTVDVLLPAKEGPIIEGDICLDFNGDKLYVLLQQVKDTQQLKFGTAQMYDYLMGKMAEPGRITNQGTNLDPNQ